MRSLPTDEGEPDRTETRGGDSLPGELERDVSNMLCGRGMRTDPRPLHVPYPGFGGEMDGPVVACCWYAETRFAMPGEGGCWREPDFAGETGRRNVASALSGVGSSSLESASGGGGVVFIDCNGDQLAELKLVAGRCADMSGSVARWAAPRGLFGVDWGLGSVGGGTRGWVCVD